MPVTLIVFPFFTQVIVFFLPLEVDEGVAIVELEGLEDAIGVGDSLATGELEGVGTTMSATLFEGEGVALATAIGAAFGKRSLS